MASDPLPPELTEAVEAAWAERLGADARIADARPVGGGCIARTARLESARGETLFLKWDGPAGIYAAEARGLAALAAADAVRVPGVVAHGDVGGVGWLLLEWLEPGRSTERGWRSFGASLARLHHTRADHFGEGQDNWIGSLPQVNGWSDSWGTFWRDRRLAPQVERALESGRLNADDGRAFDVLFSTLERRLDGPAAADGASLLHGDLWSGNVHTLKSGDAALIDPSMYYGHREVDLAMADLFGGFDPAFRRAYEESWPLEPGYREERRAIYQLYYLLVHVNLFGGGYAQSTRAALQRTL